MLNVNIDYTFWHWEWLGILGPGVDKIPLTHQAAPPGTADLLGLHHNRDGALSSLICFLIKVLNPSYRSKRIA